MRIKNGITLLVLLWLAVAPKIAEAQGVILFDEGHGQRFLVEQEGSLNLSGLSGLFQAESLQVRIGKEIITDKILADVDGLVISGAFKPFTPPEISAITDFVARGGRLCIMLHIGSPVANLLGKINVLISNGVVREQVNLIEGNDLDFYIEKFTPHELFEGIDRFKVYGGWALLNAKENAEIIAATSPKAWIDLNRNNKRDNNSEMEKSLGLVVAGRVGHGNFVVFGDDAIFQNRFLTEENILLGKNLAKWLKNKR